MEKGNVIISLKYILVFALRIVNFVFVCVFAGVIESIAVSSEGALLCTVGDDQAMKVFDVVNFDMINMLKLG